MTAVLSDQQGLRGHYAGAVSRFVAYVIDLGATTGLFMLTLAAASFAADLVVGHTIGWHKSDGGLAIAFACWQFLYFAYSWGAAGKTFGMALLGVRVVSREGGVAGARRGIVRTVVFPLSFLVCGLGFAGILVGRERRALHDVIADTAVVYTWEARAAHLRFLARKDLPRSAAVPAQAGPPAPETAVRQAP